MSVQKPPPLQRERLRPPGALPCATEKPRAAFLNGWWSGIFVGLVIGAAFGVVLSKGVH